MGIRKEQVHGHEIVYLESDTLSLTVAAGKGADIVRFFHRPSGTEFLWQSPLGLDVLKKPREEIRYIGGWIETFPNAWSGCTYRGRELAGYGDVWQLPWECRILRSDDETLQAEFSVQSRELPLLLTKTVTLQAGKSAVRIDETVRHVGSGTVHFTWGHHPNLGRPFLNEHCVIDLPSCEIWEGDRKVGDWPFLPGENGLEDLRLIPKYGASQENRQVFLRNLAESKAAVKNTATGLSFELAWDGSDFPDLLLWRAFDTGWTEMFGDRQIVCLFPKRSHGNVAEAAVRGEAWTLEPGESRDVWIEAAVLG
jgi:hypothetical protein